MTEAPSEAIRLTVPITPGLSHQISVLAFECDLTRGQLVRRALHHFVIEAKRRHADLLGLSVDEWWKAVELEYQEAQRSREVVAMALDRGEADHLDMER